MATWRSSSTRSPTYGAALTVQPGDDDWAELSGLFPPLAGARQAFDLDVDLVQTSCGYGVPLMEAVGQRDLMDRWAKKQGPDGLAAYWAEKNTRSLDGLPTGLVVGAPGGLPSITA